MAIFEPYTRQKACRHGQLLYIVNDTYVGRSLDMYGEYSEAEVELFRNVVRPGDVVVEVGANIGAHTIFLAQHVGRGGHVIAFEPQRLVFQILCANMALNHIPNVLCVQHAIGATVGSIFVPSLDYRHEYNYGAVALGEFKTGEGVPLNTLDNIELKRCDFLKIDVEGMELDVLQGAFETIKRLQPVIYVENDKVEKVNDLIRHVDKLGYTMYWDFPRYFSPANFFGNQQNVFGEMISANMLCLPKGRSHGIVGLEPVEVPRPAEP